VNFIGDAIDGFLAQRTNFPFEVIVRDDASDDGTADVVRDYASRYPGIVSLIAKDSRTYPAQSTLRELQLRAQGEFVAICEGDDYWTDELKLQRQVEALRARPDASAVFHDSTSVEVNGTALHPELDPELRRDLDSETLAQTTIPFRSLMYRRSERSVLPDRYDGRIWTEDVFLAVRLSLDGPAVFVPGIKPSAYRRHDGSLSKSLLDFPPHRAAQKVQNALCIAEYLVFESRPDPAEEFVAAAAIRTSTALVDDGIDVTEAVMRRLFRSLPRWDRLKMTLRLALGINAAGGRLSRHRR
jgi:glycosyltransferase involved in cell wall biosynthesis